VLKSIAGVAAKWNVDGKFEDLPSCRACEILFDKPAGEEQTKEERLPRPATVKRTDVTLL
jgi:hypothetical protein